MFSLCKGKSKFLKLLRPMLTIFIWFVQTFVCSSGKCYAFLSNALSGGKQRFASRQSIASYREEIKDGKICKRLP